MVEKRMRIARTRDDRIISFVCYFVTTVCAILVVYPMLNLISVSVSSYRSYLMTPWMMLPYEFDFSAFEIVFENPLIKSSYLNTIFITVVGTIFTLIITSLTAYPLSRPQLKGKSIYMGILVFTMMFGGGTIPNFLLIRSLGMYNSIWALIIPGILGAYNVILMMNFFSSLPDSLLEAAKVDGAGEAYTLVRIVIPLSTPILATIALFSAVGNWNSYFGAIIYIRDRSLWTVQLVLREIILAADTAMLEAGQNLAELQRMNIPSVSLKFASLIVVMVPIMCIYPFLQRYFVKGIMLGAVKG